MNGENIKRLLKSRGVVLAELARKIGTTPNNLSTILSGDNIKSGLIESISEATGIPVAAFYGENYAAASGTASVAVSGHGNGSISVNEVQREFLSVLTEQQRLTAEQQKLTAEQQRITADAIGNSSRLLAIIEQMAQKK